MHAIGTTVLLATTPTPSPSPVVDPDLVTPGPWGFTAIAFIALAVTLLVMDMLRRVRRARYREQVAAELDAEQAAGDPATENPSRAAKSSDGEGDSPGGTGETTGGADETSDGADPPS